jgi:hypothetical protein
VIHCHFFDAGVTSGCKLGEAMLDCTSSCVFFVLIAFMSLIFYLFVDWLYHRSTIAGGPANRWVLITGCDTGFGNAAAKRLDSIGCRVIAGCLTAEGQSALRQQCSSRLVPVLMDITSEESVQTAFKTVSNQIGSGEGKSPSKRCHSYSFYSNGMFTYFIMSVQI